jgi:HK97 gp10 family phage protein
MKIRISGLKETIAGLKSYDNRKQMAIKQIVAGSAFNIEANAKKRASVDTGRMRSSITNEFSDSGFTAKTVVPVDYAAYVEFGTSPHFPPVHALRRWAKRHGVNEWAVAKGISKNGTPAQPFLFPSFLQEKPRFNSNLRSEMRKP